MRRNEVTIVHNKPENLTDEESFLWDAIYWRTFHEICEEEYKYTKEKNPEEHLADTVLAFVTACGKEAAEDAAWAAILFLRNPNDVYEFDEKIGDVEHE